MKFLLPAVILTISPLISLISLVVFVCIHFFAAAHCLVGFPKGAYFIRMGDHHAEIVEDSEIEIFIENWYIHEEFRKGQLMNNDIAVVLLKHPIQFTSYIQPVCLPDKETIYEAGKNCTISGWGSIQYGKSSEFKCMQQISTLNAYIIAISP